MKILVIFTALLAIVYSYPSVKTWTLNELSEVIEKSEGDPEMRKYYIEALNIIMYALFTGKNEAAVHALIISPSGRSKWTLTELKTALDDPALNKAYRPFFVRSYHYLLNGKPDVSEVEVAIPALDISTWSASDISDALEDPDIDLIFKSYLEQAKEDIKKDHKKTVTIVTPVGLVRHSNSTDKPEPKLVAKILSIPGETWPQLSPLL